MADFPTSLHAAAVDWAEGAAADGWLPPDAPRDLDDAVIATPGALFDSAERPLVAALFGGTGVGKSTLMNRLAGEPVARASAERPTSRDVTIYAHRGTPVDGLANTLPMDRVRTTLHANDAWRDVLWLDMPDIDSVETANRELVTRWLPHVDALLYVVSPERYRDDEGWRLLLEHGAEHAWLFVVNHWDRGDERQIEDFRALLVAAGLPDPMIFRTDCSAVAGSPDAGGPDDFDDLTSTLGALADRQLVAQLESRGVVHRVRALQARSSALHARLGDVDALAALPARWSADWVGEADTLAEAFGWRVAPLAEAAAGGGPATTPIDADALLRIDDAVERFAQRAADTDAVPLTVARRALAPARAALHERLPRLADDALARSLATPGARWQRIAHRVCGVLVAILPLAAMAWIGWRVLDAFRDGATNPAAYLGSNFAINGGLLLALAWVLPMFLRHKLRPSREHAAARGLREGIERVLEETRIVVDDALGGLLAERRTLDDAYRDLWTHAPDDADDALPERVRRLLFTDMPRDAHRTAGVRASTQSSTEAAPVS